LGSWPKRTAASAGMSLAAWAQGEDGWTAAAEEAAGARVDWAKA